MTRRQTIRTFDGLNGAVGLAGAAIPIAMLIPVIALLDRTMREPVSASG